MTRAAILEAVALEGGPVTVCGRSMLPLYSDGSTVNVVPINDNTPIVGTVVLVRLETSLRLHRFVGWDSSGRGLTTGDAQWTLDPPVDPSDILAVVSFEKRLDHLLDRMIGCLTRLRTRFILRA